MELKKEYTSLNCNEKTQNISESFDADIQLNLPQYLDDIESVIKYNITNVLCDWELNKGSLKLFCKSIINITYLNSAGFPFSSVFEEEFSRSVDIKNENTAFADIRLNTRYSNFRLINQRRIDIHSSLNARIELFASKSVNILSECEGALLKRCNQSILNYKYAGCSGVDFDEYFDITEKGAYIKNIVNSFVSTYVSDSKIIKDKMLVKLKTEISVLYMSEDNIYQTCRYSFSSSKIIDISNAQENDSALLKANVCSIMIKAKSDDMSHLSSFEVIGRISVNYMIVSAESVDYTRDAYIPGYISEVAKMQLGVCANPLYTADEKSVELTFEPIDNLIEIISLNAQLAAVNFADGALNFIVQMFVMYYDDKSGINYIEKSKECSIRLSDDERECEGVAVITGYDYSLDSGGRITLRLNMEYKAYLYENSDISFVTDIFCDGESPVEQTELTLYFAKKDESVWDIAKKFSTDYNGIIRDNELASDIINEDRVLLVPGM
jgi:hypothetical protein